MLGTDAAWMASITARQHLPRANLDDVGYVMTHFFDDRVQALTALRVVPRGVLPVRGGVSTTMWMAASPAAAQIARSPSVIVCWITAGREPPFRAVCWLDRAGMGEEGQELIVGPADLGLQIVGQVAADGCGEDGAALPIQAPALGRLFCGRYSHGKPVRSTNRMPVSAARFGIGGRPPFGRSRAGGSSGAIATQRSSGTGAFAMPRQPVFRRGIRPPFSG